MLIQHHILRAADQGPALTYAGTGATVMFWGLHVSDIAVLLSALASVLGVFLQFYLAFHRIRRLEHGQAAEKQVIGAIAESHRAIAEKVGDK